MNAILNKLLIARNNFMPEMHLGQPRFTYKATESFTKSKERIKTFKEKGYSKHIYQNKLDKACFQNDMEYGDFNGSNRRTAADKVLRDKAFNIAKNSSYDGYQHGLDSMIYNFFLIKILQVVLLKKRLCKMNN